MKPTISKHPVLLYFVLVFVISWSMVILLFGSEGIPATEELQESIGLTILSGPFLSAIVLTIIYDKIEGLKIIFSSLLKWKVGLPWILIAIFTAPLSTFLGILVFSLFSDNYQPEFINSTDLSGLITLGLVGGLFVGFFEELGWTGFAVTKLKEGWGLIKTGVVVGLVWGAWHFILFWEENSFSELVPFLLLITRLFLWLPAYRIIMVWLYENTNSLLIIIIMHASLVASLAIIDPVLSNVELIIYILIRAIILWVGVGAILFFKKSEKQNRKGNYPLPNETNISK